jgi:hypothetical protein
MADELFRVAAQTFDPAIAVDAVCEHPDNYNQADTGAIDESLQAHGFYGGIGVQKSTGRILWGNHRHREAKKLGAATLPGFWLDVDDAEAARILAVDNRTSALAKPDEQLLVALLRPLQESPSGLLGTGYTDSALADIMRRQEALTLTGDDIDHWEGMPEFSQPGLPPAYRAVFNFPTDADADAFFAKIELQRQRVTWWPTTDGHKGDVLNMRVVNE